MVLFWGSPRTPFQMLLLAFLPRWSHEIQPLKCEQEFPTQDMTQGNASDLSDLSNSSTQIFGTLSDSCLTSDMKAFIKSFRAKRIALGYTQGDGDNELSHTNGHSSYSQSFISRFESKPLGLKAAEEMKSLRICKKHRRRTSFSNETLQFLIHTFEQNAEPSSAEIVEISSELGMEPVKVRVWFCNQKRIMKRMASGKGRGIHSLKAEIHGK